MLRLAAKRTLNQLETVTSRRSFFNYGNVGIAVLRMKDNPHYHHDPGHDTDVWKSDAFTAPGMPSGSQAVVPSKQAQTTGKERLEFLALSEGKDPYFGLMEPLDLSRRGTKTEPIMVPSPDEDRIIGCTGHPGRKHVTQWLVITRDGHKYYEFGHNRCPECGNAFKLKHVELPFPSIN